MKTITQSILSLLAIVSFSFSVHAAQNNSDIQPASEKEWTFLLFLNGHNSLSSYSDSNLIDMEKVGSNDQVNYVVEWGKMGDKLTRRLRVEKSTNPSKVTSPTVMSMPDHDMGDYKNLIEFVRWGVAKYPAKHYFIAVWNHGSGWKRMTRGTVLEPKDISFDDNTNHKITTEELGLALAESKKIIGHNVDIYGSDACLMQMAEVATQMKDSVDYVVGSQETEPGDGWPYQPFFQKWSATPSQTPMEVSSLLSKEYLKAYNGGGVYSRSSVTFSSIDMSKMDALINSTTALAAHLKSLDKATLKKIKAEVYNVTNFYYSDYVDFGDFLKRIDALAISHDSKLFSQVASDIKSLVVTTDNSSSFAGATGLSIWLPTYATSDMARYSNLEFSKATGWDQFVKAMLAAQ